MYRKTHIALLVVILIISVGLFAEKTKERLANEKGVEGENFWEEGKYFECANAMEEAIRLLNEAVAEDGIPADEEKIDRWLNIAFSAYVKDKDYENALKIQDKRIERDPEELDLYNNKALLQKGLERYDAALETYFFMDNMKQDYKVRDNIAKIYKDREDWDNALLWYNKSYEIRKSSKTIKNIAVINLQLGRNEKAIAAYEDFLSTEPSQAAQIKTYKNLGKLYEDLGDSANSIKNYEQTLSMRYDPQIALLLIVKYFEMKNYDDCLKKIEIYLKDKPGNSDALYYRAQIKYDQRDLVGARADFESILSDPKYSATAKGFIESIDSE